ncbi:hemagglutinin repeat-containing protein [Rodentibacter heidelbergensis]|uniref:Filamentous haemagglutinin FhaB/tRNA nuclease CdiA-like TPS domain-containing protein n=1 Tax=Rodentibacter heidelbergensis TaxID=1908258 RepID=A0A1V3IC94_9PAST|nr:hemagglutinin repeat-containing protein [Rodentibacter heidelbergensis]OOF37662.1 hypothetical protein BKK48_01670 [Rodentibacter heidelbergensis]
MNKNCFRVIFSKTLQCLVVTSELAKTEGKSTERTSSGFPQLFAKIQPLTFSLFCALGLVSFSHTAYAELIIRADKSAPKNQQPIVLQTANGLPQVNIQTPNEQGLSHNKYRQFDVDTKGAILNNSRTQVQTQQGGWVQGNPYLARGEAKVILNEVNSSDPSVLKGYVEVAGKKADVIIANPSGIHCEGCGVINSDRTTLTTGKPQIQQGHLESFVVEKGKVSVSGKGLDNSRVDYTEIIAREAQINAGVWSKKEMKVMTGKNTVKRTDKAEDLQIIHTRQTSAQESKPKVAIDVGQLGGMYAGKIHLIGTEQGVGVHNAGHIGASAETLKIDSQGRIVNTGTLNANKAIELTGTKGIENHGKIENRQGDITLNTPADIQQDGSLVARSGNLRKTANRGITQQGESIAKGNINYNAPSVTASTGSLIAAGVAVKDTAEGEKRTVENTFAQGKTIAINSSGKATLQGKQLASGQLTIHASEVNLDHSRNQAYAIQVQARQGDIQANEAWLTAQQNLVLDTPTTLSTSNSRLNANKIRTKQTALNNAYGVWLQTGTEDFKLSAQSIHNLGGTFSTQGHFFIDTQRVDNTKGKLIAGGKLEVDTHQGQFLSSSGLLFANQTLSLYTGQLDNRQGRIQGEKSVRIETHNHSFNNQAGKLFTGSDLILNSAALSNAQGNIQADGQINIETAGSQLDNDKGIVSSGSALTLNSGNLTNHQGIIRAQQATIQAASLNQREGVIKADNALTVLAKKDLTSQDNSLIEGGKVDLTIGGSFINNGQSDVVANQLHLTTTQGIDNQQGNIKATQAVTLFADRLDNQGGTIAATQGAATLKITQALQNLNGTINAKTTLNLTALGVNNTQGRITTEQGEVQLNAQGEVFDNRNGKLLSGGLLTLSAGAIDNRAGFIQTTGDADITARDLNNARVGTLGSAISSHQHLRFNVSNIDNQATKAQQDNPTQGLIVRELTLNGRQLNNQGGGIYSLVRADFRLDSQLNNHQGEILSWGDLQIKGSPNSLSVNNTQGILQANNKLNLTARAFSEDGHIEAGYIDINVQADVHTKRDINAYHSLKLTTAGQLVNQHRLSANDLLQLQAGRITNHQSGRISSAQTQVISASTLHNEGLINSFNETENAGTLIKAKQIDNIGTGRIYGDYVALQADTVLNKDQRGNDGKVYAATIAARKQLDIGAKHITNLTENYEANRKSGALIYSEGGIFFGDRLDQNNHATGQALSLKNFSSIIEAGKGIGLKIKDVANTNIHYQSTIQETSNVSVSKSYILPNDLATGDAPYNNGKLPYIDTKGLKRVNYSRAWKYVRTYDPSRLQVITDSSQLTKDQLLAIPNTADCVNGECRIMPESVYGKDNPIWQYFNLTAPAEEMPNITPAMAEVMNRQKQEGVNSLTPSNLSEDEIDALDGQQDAQMNYAPIVPAKPIEPKREDYSSPFKYRQAKAKYNRDLIAYNKAVQDKADYETLLPLISWTAKYGDNLKALSDAIDKHNSPLLGEEFYRFWEIFVDRERVEENITTASLPAQILAGENITYQSDRFLNDKSWVISGQAIRNEGSGTLKNLDDEDAITRNIEEGWRDYTYTRWRGGFRRYHERKYNQGGALKRVDEQHKEMGIFVQLENTLPASYQHYQSGKSRNDITKVQNGVNSTDIGKLNVEVDKGKVNFDNNTNQSSKLALERIPIMDKDKGIEVRSIPVDTRLPTQSLYRINPNADSHVLVETDPDFTQYKKWLSSDYMYKALRYEHENVHKRLGDGYYEQRLVREQINLLTGRQYLGNYQDFESQYKGLMDAGITFAKSFHLTPGVKLSAEQVAALTSDIVWLEKEQVRLDDGSLTEVVVPKVYAVVKKGDVSGNGTLFSANQVQVKTQELVNQGTIAGRQLVLLDSQSIRNSGKVSGGTIAAEVSGDMKNIGGVFEADEALLLNVKGDLAHQSTSRTTEVNLDGYQRRQTNLDRKALFHVKGENGTLQVQANNLNLTGAEIINEGKGQTYLSSKNNLNLTALSVGFDEKMGGGNHYRNEAVQGVEISRVKGKGDVVLGGGNIYSEGAVLESEAKLTALAKNDLVLNGAKESRDFEEFHKTKSGSLAKVTKTSFDKKQSETQRGTQVSGEAIILAAGNDVKGKGLQAIAENDLLIQAGRNVDIAADTNHFRNIHKETKKTSGVFSGGGIGITFGSKSEKHHLESEGWTQSDARSTLGSMNGDIQIQAGKHAKVMGTDLITPRTNRIDIEGAAVKVEAGKDIINTSERHEYQQSGLTLAVSSPVVDTALSMMGSIKRSGEVKNEKLKKLHQMKAAYESLELAKNVATTADTLSNLGKMTEGDVSNPSVKLSVSIGASQSKQRSETQTVTHSGSELSAGTVAITGRQGDVDILGSTINAKRAELAVAKNLNVESVQDSYRHRSENKNSGWSVGVFLGASGNSYGFGIEGSAQVGKGHENSDSITQRNSALNAEETLIKTGQDANFKGAKLNTTRLSADIQGNLNLESRQDSNQYASKQEQAGAGFSVAIYGSGSNASANYAQNKAKVNYRQVEEQTGFHVGEGGLNVKVGGNTHLKGAVIESRAEASKNHFKTQSLTHSDIENHSEVEVKSISAGLSTDMAQNAKNAMATAASLLGNKQESERSTTKSAISENIHIDTETPEKLTALSRDTQNANQKVKAFDLTEIKEQQEAVQVAGALFSKITGDVAKAFDFEDGSQEKILMHGLAGALAAKMGDGNIATGAVAGAGSEWLNTYVADYLKSQTQGLNLEPQQKEKLRQAAQQATALMIGAMAGAVTGGSSETVKQGALASYNAESFNRQLHPEQIELIRERAKNFAEQQGISEEQALAQLTAEALRGESDDFTYVEKNQAARDYLNNLAKETKVPTLFSELDRKSDEYRNSLLNAQYVTANQDLYNRVNRREKNYATTTADYVLNSAIREGKSYYQQAGKETVSQVYGSAKAEVNRYRELEQYHANQESDKDEQLARKYRHQANSLSGSLSQNYQSGTGLFDFSELYANKNPLAKTMFETIAESGYVIGGISSTKVIFKDAKIGNFISKEKLLSHFEKHSNEFGNLYSTPKDYLTGARYVMNTGIPVEYMYKGELRNGFVKYLGNTTRKGEAKFAFVGTNLNKDITTYHTKSGKEFWRLLNNDNSHKVIYPKENKK